MLSWDEMTFGFEFEFIGKASIDARQRFEEFMVSHGIPYIFTGVYGKNSPEAWTLGADSSVGDHTTNKDIDKAKKNFGYELVSPILHASDFPTVKTVLDGVKEILNGYVNDTCGTHVHFGNVAGMTCRNDIHKGNLAASFMNGTVWLYTKLQPYLWDNLIINKRLDNEYCMTYQEGAYESEKYLALSARGKHDTLESRRHHGTLDYDEIIEWAMMNARFITYCYNNKLEIKLDPSLDKKTGMIALLEQFGYTHEDAESVIKRRLARIEKIQDVASKSKTERL